jgi:hypothetical protein
MDGLTAALNQSKYSIQATLTAGNAQCRSRLKAELSETYDVCKIRSTETIVIGDVQKDGIGLDTGNRHSFQTSLLGSESCAPLLDSSGGISMALNENTTTLAVPLDESQKRVLPRLAEAKTLPKLF